MEKVFLTILNMSITASWLAFGEVGVKERVRTVKNYKKPAFWIVVIGIVVCIGLAVGFLTNPKEDGKHFMVMYNDNIYEKVEETIPVLAYIYAGEITSVTEKEKLIENFQATEELVGCKIYESLDSSDYIFVKKDGAYIACKGVSVVGNSDLNKEEISEKELINIKNYILDYCEEYVPSENEALNDLVDTISDDDSYSTKKGTVTVTIIQCTEEKIALFKEYILDSEALVFKNFSVEMLNLPTAPDKEVDWEEEYGALEPGLYRIGKKIGILSADGEVKNNKEIMLYAEFRIK